MNEVGDRMVSEAIDGSLWITFNRADKANALTVAMMEQATDALSAAQARDDIRTVLLTGAGERVFSAGVDVREQPADGDMATQRERRSKALAALQDAVMSSSKPVVAVLNGSAIGGGAMLALMADACVAVEGASLSLPEIDLGIPTFSGASILEAIGGRALVLDLIQCAAKMPAQVAMTRGLLKAVLSRDALKPYATELAHTLGAKNPSTFAANKRWINRKLVAALAEAREQHARHRAGASR